jgi:hypothetical protein
LGLEENNGSNVKNVSWVDYLLTVAEVLQEAGRAWVGGKDGPMLRSRELRFILGDIKTLGTAGNRFSITRRGLKTMYFAASWSKGLLSVQRLV